MPTDDDTFLHDVLPPLPQVLACAPDLSSTHFHAPSRCSSSHCPNPSRCSSSHSMESALDSAERPVSYTSTSSSASSRDSHCSLGGRHALMQAPPRQDHQNHPESGAIRLELVPTQQLEDEDCKDLDGKGTRSDHQSPTSAELKETTETTEQGLSLGQRTTEQGLSLGQRSTEQGLSLGQRNTEQGLSLGQRTYVDRVVQEILETERTYVRDLQSIVEECLQSITEQCGSELTSEDQESLFGNIQEIYHFNRSLLQDLEQCEADPVAIAECFVTKSEDFHIYTQYCTNYPRSVAVLTDCMRNKTLAKLLRERQETLHHSLPLGSYLLKPVQRILKYHLLLHEMVTHLDDSVSVEMVQEAIDTMQRVARHINDMKRKHEHSVRLQEVQSLLMGWKGPDLMEFGELVLEGTFRLQRAKNLRSLFLLEKLLLITKKREESYSYKAHILCCNLMLVEVIPKDPLSFSVFHYKNPKLQHTVQARSQLDKRLWIQHLKRLILENHPAKIPAKAKQAILEMDASLNVADPGFQFSPEGERTRERPSPRRGRRKEPLSKLLKNVKQNAANRETEKRSSLGASLSPVSQLALGTIGRSRSLINQSQESLDPGDHCYHSDREEGEEPYQRDADDEDDSGIGGSRRLTVPGRSSRKRLNPQASVDNIDQWKSFNMSPSDLQRARESLSRDSSRHPPLRRSSRVSETPPDSPVPSVIVTQTDQSVSSIWADHRARRAMFPPRQHSTMQPDDEDIYQMFVLSEAPHPQPSPIASPRPASWHQESVPGPHQEPVTGPHQEPDLAPPVEAPPPGKLVRRASSGGEKASEQSPDSDLCCSLDTVHTESSSNDFSASSSSEHLDHVENVYDNIHFQDLQRMGLIRRELRQEPVEITGIKPESSSESNRSSTQEATRTSELKMEENVYDTVCFQELPAKDSNVDMEHDVESLLVSEQDLAESLKGFASEESLQFEDEANDNVTSCWSDLDLSSSGASDTLHQHKGDRMSERVDEIWNDLENYIKVNEKKPDRLPAAFPVNKSSPKKKLTSKSLSQTCSPPSRKPSTVRIPVLTVPDIKVTAEEEVAQTSTTPEPQHGTVKSLRNRLVRLSSGSFRLDEDDDLVELSPKSPSPKDLLFPGELANLDLPLASSSLLLGDSADFSSELEKSRSRVFLMARQYSQKIKKANQLLRMRSMDPGDTCPRARAEKKQKDLAAILEEKKQGGAAIGARIAEYSQLYDQVLFPPGSPFGPPPPASPCHPHHLSSSPSLPETCSDQDWLHSTYSNRELTSFMTSSTPLRPPLPPNPAPKSPPPAPKAPPAAPKALAPPSQRWSSCVSAQSEEEDHVYSTIKRHASFNTTLFARDQPRSETKKTNKCSGHFPSLGQTGRHQSLPESSDITDGKPVLLLNHNSALSILAATQNYLANFKDNGEDDDDYVEIRSEDETEPDPNPKLEQRPPRGLSHSLPGTPVRTCESLSALQRHHLEKYLWSEQPRMDRPRMDRPRMDRPRMDRPRMDQPRMDQPRMDQPRMDQPRMDQPRMDQPRVDQPRMVQSLREKLQCLSSSSFA